MRKKYTFASFKEFLLLLVILFSLTVRSQSCADVSQRVYASSQSWFTTLLGNVSQANSATDANTDTYSVINTGLVVAGIGSTVQILSWGGDDIEAGTPLSIKLGTETAILAAGSVVSVQARKDGANIGASQIVTSDLLSLVSGESTYEFTFVPMSGGVPEAYDEVRITISALAGIGFSVRVYEAYYHTPSQTIADCSDIIDLFYGVEDLGIGLLTGTIGVSNPWNVADGDSATYATLYNGAAVLARAQLTAVFSSPMQGSDELEISISNPGTSLSVEALNGFTIQRYNGADTVGTPLTSSSNIVSVGFLGSSDSEATVIIAPDDSLVYDRIKISLGGVADVLNGIRIHEIKRRAGFQISGVQDSVIYLEPGDSTSFTIQNPTDCTTFQVFDQNDDPLTMTGNTFELPGGLIDGQTYNFYVQGYRYGCPFGESKQIVVIVGDFSVDPADCPDVFNRVYATNQLWNTVLLGGVTSNPELAVDGDPSTHSTITVALGVLGLGTTYQNLSWGGTVISAGTPVSIKLGPEIGVLGIGSGLSVIGRRNGSNIGYIQSIDGALLSLIPGENVYEYTFIPSAGGIPQEYDEIRIALGGLVAAGVSVRIFEAYYHTSTETLADCGTGDVLDLFYGVEDLGIEVLTATVGVADAWDAVDGDDQTYATIYNGASVLAQAQLTVIFSTPSIETDKLEIKVSKPGELLTVGLLDGFVIQRYYGSDAVGGPLDFSSSLLSLGLLNPGDDEGTIVFAPDDGLPYDRIKISLGGVANVLDGLRIHEVVRKPFIKLDNSNDMEVILCIDDVLGFDQVDECTVYQVEDEDGNPLTLNGTYAFDLPDDVVAGNTYIYNVQALRYGCPFGVPQEITVTVLPRAEESELNDILVNGGFLQSLCLETGEEVELEISISDTSTIINPVFVWYDSDDTLIAGGETGLLNLGILTSGTYTYFVGVYGDNFCESLPEERKEVTFTVEYEGLPSDIDIDGDGENICFTDSATFTPTSTTVATPVFTWYLTNDTSSPITDGDIDGAITYNVNATGILTVTGLAPGTSQTYFVTVSGDGVCENSPGNFAQATVNVYDVDSPTTTAIAQNFCLIDSPTVSDIQVNESGVIWYDSVTGGTAYTSSDVLVSGTYYGALVSAEGCESSTRLEVTVTVDDAITPTTSNTSQEFCLINLPTVSDIQVNESGVIWYDSVIGGTVYAPSDVLVNGTYYGALVSAEGCESSTRLEVTVMVDDAITPTTSSTSQEFCLIDLPTVSDIQVNESGVIWYDSVTGGTAYTSSDVLVSGTYYGALVSAEGCESSVRLEVTVTVDDVLTPTGDTEQSFCAVDQPAVSDILVNESGVVWYDAPVGGTAYGTSDLLVDGIIYYGGIVLSQGCESTVRLAVTVSLINVLTPTTDNVEQSFCAGDSPAISDIQVNEPGVIWYDSPQGGIAYNNSDLVIDGTIYYAALMTPEGCKSVTRLAVTVTVNDAPTPTTSSASQEFCLIDSPTILDIQVNESGVIWYDSATGGTAYTSTDTLISGVYYGVLISEEGCESSERLEVTVTLNEGGDPTITSDISGEICLHTVGTYTTESGHNNYNWEVIGGEIISGGSAQDDFISIMWTSTGNVLVSVSYDGNNECYSGNTVMLEQEVTICADITILKEVSNLTPMIGEEVTFTVTVTNSGPNDFENVLVSEVLQSGFSYISSQTTTGIYSPVSGEWNIDVLSANQTAILTIIVEVLDNGDYVNIASIISSDPEDSDGDNNSSEVILEPICLFVFNEFSPNDDGMNDYFIITCIEDYPNNELKVFNKYGSLVYKRKGYDNTWSGVANAGGIPNSGEVLPSDTYYYVLDLGESRKPKTGWLFIIR